MRACLRKAWLSSRARRQLAVGEQHLHALVAQDPQAATRGLLRGIVGGDEDTPDPRLQDRLGAWRRLALVAARLQRHVQRRRAQVRHATCLDRVDLRVQTAELFMPALAQHLAVASDHGAHDRIGLDRAGAIARQLDRPFQVRAVGIRAGRHVHSG
jgi:hypothetical protein